MRKNLVPGVLLQLTALTLTIAYFTSAPFSAWLDAIGAVKQEVGYPFSALSTAIFGGVIPSILLAVTGRLVPGQRLLQCAFYVGFWAIKGIEVDAFYRLQAYLFGNSATVLVIAKKTFVDQFIYNPLWAGPTQVWFFLWMDSGFSISAMRKQFREQSFASRVLVILLSSWVVWIPTVAIVYALPAALQIPLFNLVLCFWCLLLTSLSRREG